MSHDSLSPAADESVVLRAWEILRRRRLLASAVFLTLVASAAGFAAYLPDLYQASALVLIERQVSEAVAKPQLSGELENRLQVIKQEILSRARDLFASANYERFASLVARVSRALITESYRAGAAWSVIDEHDEVGPDQTATGPASPARPYFEVLVVETLTPAQEQALREEVRGWRRPSDHFIYELVVVGSGHKRQHGVPGIPN